MKKIYNFSAGPAVLPEEVLQEAKEEMTDYGNTGMSVMEISHRSDIFEKILNDAEEDLRQLLHIPSNYEVLFLQGGATMQFSMIPLNFLKNGSADYVITGQWSKKAYEEAKKFGKVSIAASSRDRDYSYLPDHSKIKISKDADYVYICENNTVYGTKFHDLPDTKGKPLIADVSSCFLSEPADITKYAMMYGGAQKNIGPAGVAVSIIRKDMLKKEKKQDIPILLDYHTYAEFHSLYNTPPVYGIYICGKVFRWIIKNGGLTSVQERNIKKAKLLYDFLDASNMFYGTADKKDRSYMNVTFRTRREELDQKFIKEAQKEGLLNLKGHKTAGGMRASIYNAMSYEGVEKLTQFMERFEKENR